MRELEERGIGRPSTYAEIISKVQARDYVEKIDGDALPPDARSASSSSTGSSKSELDFMDPAFTSKMEEELDEVEAGKEERVDLLKRFYKRFRDAARLEQEGQALEPRARADRREVRARRRRDAQALVARTAGSSAARTTPSARTRATSGPTATPTRAARDRHRLRQVRQADGHPQRALRRVPVVHRLPRVQEREARAARRQVPEVRRRPHRDSPEEARRQDRSTAARTTPNEAIKCDFKLWQKPIAEPCPSCGAPFLVMGGTRTKPMIACANKECGYKRPVVEPASEGTGAAIGGDHVESPPAAL